jgi:hypothetical protein
MSHGRWFQIALLITPLEGIPPSHETFMSSGFPERNYVDGARYTVEYAAESGKKITRPRF